MNHISYRRIIELAKHQQNITENEAEHLSQCPFCENQIFSLSELDKRIKETSRVEPIFNADDIGEMADKIFDRYHSAPKQFSFFKYFAVSITSALFAVLLVTALLFTAKKEPFAGNLISEAREPVQNEITEEETSKNDIKYAQKTIFTAGEKALGKRYYAKILNNSVLLEEHDNFVTVTSGEATFSVKGEGDFIVNLNNIAFIRVLGTVFTVKVDSDSAFVKVEEGSVEFIDLDKGEIVFLSAYEFRRINLKAEKANKTSVIDSQQTVISSPFENVGNVNSTLSSEMEKLFKYKGREDSNLYAAPSKKPEPRYRFKKDPNLMDAEIRDLEFLLKFSDAPVAQLQQLFVLLAERKHYGSIIHYWRVYSKQINSDANPFLHEMHRFACEASINLYLYDNGVCRNYNERYPGGPNPAGMNDHLNMAW